VVAPLDFEHARRFVASVPEGRWTTYKDVATAGGNRRGAMAIGQWLRHNGATIPNYWRVLRANGYVPDNFTGDGSGSARDAESARETLRQEGVSIGANGRADRRQRYLVEQWPEYRPSLDDPSSVPEPQATAALPHQLAARVSDDNAFARRGTPELLRDWSMIMRELRRRDIIRTNNNPVGDIAEAIVAEYYQGQRGSFSQAGWDVKTAAGERIQVKAMRQTPETKRRNLSPIRDREYDVVVVVVFDEDFVVTEGLRITREVVEELFPHRAHVNGRVIIVTQTLRQDPRVQHLDLTVAAQRLST
jgi:alkylated DNA nucleotide flippase Atl1